MKNFKLCYIRDNFAYFTTQELDKQTGDDWNDAPYEHNAGEPYAPSLRYFTADRQEKVETDWNEDGTPKWEIMKIAFDCSKAETPAQMAFGNSKYSVQMINNKLIPWLTITNSSKALFAGASIGEFVKFIEESEGEIFFSKSYIIEIT
jgi:hypothetical protein